MEFSLFTLELKKFRQSGFTLPEIMVGGVILVGLGLAGGRMFKDQRQAQSKVDQEQAVNIYHQMLTKQLQNENVCSATLKNAWNYTPAQMATFDVDDIFDCETCTAANVDYDASTVTQNATNFGEGKWILPNLGIWKIIDISWKSVPDATGPAVLKVTYGTDPSWPGSRAQKVYSYSKDVNLMLRFTQNSNPALRQFKECVAGKQSAINNLQNDICGSMSQVTSTGNIMEWDDATQGCKAKGVTGPAVKVCSTANMVIDGINSDGTVRCRSLTFGVNPGADLAEPTGCAPGATVRMEYDSVTKKLKARCD